MYRVVSFVLFAILMTSCSCVCTADTILAGTVTGTNTGQSMNYSFDFFGVGYLITGTGSGFNPCWFGCYEGRTLPPLPIGDDVGTFSGTVTHEAQDYPFGLFQYPDTFYSDYFWMVFRFDTAFPNSPPEAFSMRVPFTVDGGLQVFVRTGSLPFDMYYFVLSGKGWATLDFVASQGGMYELSHADLSFTREPVVPIPEPGSIVLLASGLLGMFGAVRRQFH